MQFDLTKTFDMIGKRFCLGLKRRIEQQTGIDGAPYSPAAPSTIQGRARAMKGSRYVFFSIVKEGRQKGSGVMRRGAHYTASATSYNPKRLYITHDLANSGFRYQPDTSGVNIFVSGQIHGKGKSNAWASILSGARVAAASYAAIIRYNSRGQSRLNPKIKQPPLVFPTNTQEVNLMANEIAEAKKLILLDLKRQMKLGAKRTLTIG